MYIRQDSISFLPSVQSGAGHGLTRPGRLQRTAEISWVISRAEMPLSTEME